MRPTLHRVSRLLCFMIVSSCGLFAQVPILTIDSGGHSGAVIRLLFTADGKQVVSGGEDKVIRVWDVATQKSLRTIRGEISEGKNGKIYAMALSPDEHYLAVAGWLGPKTPFGIRIHDFRSGDVIGPLLTGHEDSVTGLEFSPDGKILASSSSDGTIRLWDMTRRQALHVFKDHKGRVQSVSFSPKGDRLVSAGFDKTVRLYDVAKRKQIALMPGHTSLVYSAAFSPDDRYLASIDDSGVIRLWNPQSGQSIQTLASIGTGVTNLVFTDNSHVLSCAEAGRFVCSIVNLADGSSTLHYSEHDNVVFAAAASPRAGLAATAGGNQHEILVWKASTGETLGKLAGQGQRVANAAYSTDGKSILFGTTFYSTPQRNEYGPLDRVLALQGNDESNIVLASQPRNFEPAGAFSKAGNRELRVRDDAKLGSFGEGSILEVLENGAVKRTFKRDESSGRHHYAYTLTGDGRFAISGGLNGFLSLYDINSGDESMLKGHTGLIWSVKVSRDGKTLITGADDQTIRLWDLPSGTLRLTIFVVSDSDWIAWSPRGYYCSTASAANYIGWHVNRGEDKAASYYTLAQFRKDFYRPDIIAKLFRIGEVPNAKLSAADIPSMLPPEVRLTVPESVRGSAATVKIQVDSSNLPITDVHVFLNGSELSIDPISTESRSREWTVPLQLSRGQNSLYVTASTSSATSRGTDATIPADGSGSPPPPPGNLYVLAIGVSKYTKANPLQFADADAKSIVEALSKQKDRKLYANVETRIVVNEDATRARIATELQWLSSKKGERDTRVLFLAGHGAMGYGGYNFLEVNYDPSKPDDSEQGIHWQDILNRLTQSAGKSILMIDTCRSGATAQALDFNRVLMDMYAGKGSIVTFAASTGDELAQEIDGHGRFTSALLASLGASRAVDDQELYWDELGVGIRRHVQFEQKATTQHPTTFALPLGMPPFPIFSGATR